MKSEFYVYYSRYNVCTTGAAEDLTGRGEMNFKEPFSMYILVISLTTQRSIFIAFPPPSKHALVRNATSPPRIWVAPDLFIPPRGRGSKPISLLLRSLAESFYI
jgi:hypothetical protein